MGADTQERLFSSVSNPIVGLFIGVVGTVLVQSSSASTSLIVGLVASGALGLDQAVPMIMGANIGTTVTSSIAALGHVGNRVEFRRAFAAATCHDFFNYLAVIVLLPIELMTGYLQHSSLIIAGWFEAGSTEKYKSPFKASLKTCYKAIKGFVNDRFEEPGTGAKIVLACVGLIIIFICLVLIVKVMRTLVPDRMQSLLSKALDSSIIVGLFAGALLTVAAQSSSITTSVMVPLAGAGLITLRQTLPLVLGANVGTTVTALIAAIAVIGDQAMAARQIAMVHLLFNLTGIILLYSVPRAVDVPIGMAQRLAVVADHSKRWAFIYIVGMFYGVPALLYFISNALQ